VLWDVSIGGLAPPEISAGAADQLSVHVRVRFDARVSVTAKIVAQSHSPDLRRLKPALPLGRLFFVTRPLRDEPTVRLRHAEWKTVTNVCGRTMSSRAHGFGQNTKGSVEIRIGNNERRAKCEAPPCPYFETKTA
jgi:hypothetical protein